MSLFVTLPAVGMLIGIFHIGKFCFYFPFFKKLLLRNHEVDFVEICNVYAGKVKIEAKRITNSDYVCRSYSDLNFGVTFLEHSVVIQLILAPYSTIVDIVVKLLYGCPGFSLYALACS